MEEAELNLLDEINARIPASDFQAEYFPGGMVRITMSITAEMAGQIKALAEQRGWPEADAYVAMLATGIGALKEARARELLAEEGEAAQDELDLLVRQMRQMETQYAVLKFRAWNFLQAYQASAMSQGALVNRADGLSVVVDRLRAENESLRMELERLKGAVAAANAAASQGNPTTGKPEPPAARGVGGILRRLFPMS